MLFHITDCINTTSVGVVTKRLQCPMSRVFSVDLRGRSGFILPLLYLSYSRMLSVNHLTA